MSRTLKVVEAINALSREPFRWGVCDCCMFAARVVASYAPHLGPWPAYGSEEEAEALIAKAGGLRPLIDVLADTEAVSVADTHDGDPLLARLPNGRELLAVRLHDLAVYKTARHVSTADIRSPRLVCGWRVG